MAVAWHENRQDVRRVPKGCLTRNYFVRQKATDIVASACRKPCLHNSSSHRVLLKMLRGKRSEDSTRSFAVVG